MNSSAFPMTRIFVLFWITCWIPVGCASDLLDKARRMPAVDVPWKYQINADPNKIAFKPIMDLCNENIGAIIVQAIRLKGKNERANFWLVQKNNKKKKENLFIEKVIKKKNGKTVAEKDALKFRIYLPDVFGEGRASCKDVLNRMRPRVISKNHEKKGRIRDLQVSLVANGKKKNIDQYKKYFSNYYGKAQKNKTCGPRWIKDPIKEKLPAIYALVLPKGGDCNESSRGRQDGKQQVSAKWVIANRDNRPGIQSPNVLEVHLIRQNRDGEPAEMQGSKNKYFIAFPPSGYNPIDKLPYIHDLQTIGEFSIKVRVPSPSKGTEELTFKFNGKLDSLPKWPGISNIGSCQKDTGKFYLDSERKTLVAVFCPKGIQARKVIALLKVVDQTGKGISGITDWNLYDSSRLSGNGKKEVPRDGFSIIDKGEGLYLFASNKDDLKSAVVQAGSLPAQFDCGSPDPIKLDFSENPKTEEIKLSCFRSFLIKFAGRDYSKCRYYVKVNDRYPKNTGEWGSDGYNLSISGVQIGDEMEVQCYAMINSDDTYRYEPWDKKVTLTQQDLHEGSITIPVELSLKRYDVRFVFKDDLGNPVKGVRISQVSNGVSVINNTSDQAGVVELSLAFLGDTAEVAVKLPKEYQYHNYDPLIGDVSEKNNILRFAFRPRETSSYSDDSTIKVYLQRKLKPIVIQPYVKVDGEDINASSCKISRVTLRGQSISVSPIRGQVRQFKLPASVRKADPNDTVKFYFTGVNPDFTICASAPVSMRVHDLLGSQLVRVPVGLTPPWLLYFGDGGEQLNKQMGYDERVRFWGGAVSRLNGLIDVKQPSVVRAYAVKRGGRIIDLLGGIDKSNISRPLQQYPRSRTILSDLINNNSLSLDSAKGVIIDSAKRLKGYSLRSGEQGTYKALVLYLFDAGRITSDFCFDLADWVDTADFPIDSGIRLVLIGGVQGRDFGQDQQTGINRCNSEQIADVLIDKFGVASFSEIGVYPYLFSWRTMLATATVSELLDKLLANPDSPLMRSLSASGRRQQ